MESNEGTEMQPVAESSPDKSKENSEKVVEEEKDENAGVEKLEKIEVVEDVEDLEGADDESHANDDELTGADDLEKVKQLERRNTAKLITAVGVVIILLFGALFFFPLSI